MKKLVLLAAALALAGTLWAVDPAFKAPMISAEELARTLRDEKAERPAMFSVGFRVLFVQAHIPGSVFVGPGREEPGLDLLRAAIAKLPKEKAIVLYCGCCPWERCPNIEPAWRVLKEAGFSNVKILMLPMNFGVDWVRKGYPVEKG